MEILHTGDWHIGKLVHGVHMTEDAKTLLNQWLAYLSENKPDVMIIAGDVYDRSVPPVEAVALLNEIFSELVLKLKIKVIVISGNHDNGERLGFGSELLKQQGLYIYNRLEQVGEALVIEDNHGPVNFYPIPYIEPPVARIYYNDDTIKTHDDVYKKVLSDIKNIKNNQQRSVCIAHGLVMGGLMPDYSESERPLSIGGSDAVSVDYFKDYDYVALGHLHKPQKVSFPHIRYAGSLLKYSFSEAHQKKGMTRVTLGKDGFEKYEIISFKPIRDLRILKGDLKALLEAAKEDAGNKEDYIMAVLTDEGELYEPLSQLRSVYPNVLKLERQSLKSNNVEKSPAEDFRIKPPMALFGDFFEYVEETKLQEKDTKWLSKAIERAYKEEDV